MKTLVQSFWLVMLLVTTVAPAVAQRPANAVGANKLGVATDEPQAPMTYDVFEAVAIDPASLTKLRSEVTQAQIVSTDLDALRYAKIGDVLRLAPLPGIEVEGAIRRITARGSGCYTVHGRFAGDRAAHFNLVVENGAVAGTILIPSKQLWIQIRPIRDGIQLAAQIDTEKTPRCGGSLNFPNPGPKRVLEKEPERRVAEEQDKAPGTGDGGGDDPGTACTDTGYIHDVMFVFTNVARQMAGGTNNIVAILLNSIDDANTAYENSDIGLHVRMVARREIAYDENGTYEDHLNRLTIVDDGVMDQVHGWREDFEADAVMLFVDDNEYCGLAWCCATEEAAFGVVTWDCPTFVFSHEFGHNQGCAHNPEDADCDGCNNTARGHHFDGDDGVHYGTIMSYRGTQFLHFSDPNVRYQGQPTGTSDRNNARQIRASREDVEEFNLTRFDIWVDFAYDSEFQAGTFGWPYSTFARGVTYISSGDGPSELPVLHIRAGSSNETAAVSKPMIIRACGGTVRIGKP